jgi:hypothetical protein
LHVAGLAWPLRQFAERRSKASGTRCREFAVSEEAQAALLAQQKNAATQ